MENPESMLPPGFRFHPTDEELILHYLRKQATSLPCPVSIIAEVDIYKFDPWDLPAKARFGDREWYFFSPRDRKYPNGARPNRAAASGYWKATGTDKAIVGGGGKESIGVKKALVFYKGRPPKGHKTNWIMHEYRLAQGTNTGSNQAKRPRDSSMRLDDWVLCRIYNKSSNPASSSSDRDVEDSNSEDAFYTAPQNAAKLPKCASLSDLLNDADFSMLSRLLHDNPSDMACPELSSLMGPANPNQPFAAAGCGGDGDFSFSLPKLAPVECHVPVGKRMQVAADDGDVGGAVWRPPKRYNSSCTGYGNVAEQVDGAAPCCTVLNQPFLHQQILLNSTWDFNERLLFPRR